jgi:DNA adenine methylase
LRGAIIGLTVAFENLADEVVLVEMDAAIAAVWKTILGRNADWLSKRILDFEVSVDNVREQLAKPTKSTKEQAFNTILRNRTFHGGIMAHGSSLIKHGEKGKGVASRWYPETLAKRIRDIHEIRDKITFIEGDGLSVIEKHARKASTFYFVDPPYTASEKKAGKRLYNHSEIDHSRLFDLLASAKGDFLMTYDEDPTVREMAESRGFTVDLIPMQSRRLNTMMEFLIGKDASWLEAPTQ